MALFGKIIVFTVAALLVIVLQSSRFLAIYGIQPNLFLIFVLAAAYFYGGEKRISVVLPLAFILSGFAAAFTIKFYFFQIAIIIFLGLLALWVRSFLTGEPNADFLMLAGAGTIVFYLIGMLLRVGAFPVQPIVYELLLNLLIALGVVYVFKKIYGEKSF